MKNYEVKYVNYLWDDETGNKSDAAERLRLSQQLSSSVTSASPTQAAGIPLPR
ncbi:MAG: hypothetical protein IPO22_23835 [Anaerolineales bacterium]|nr:hypothetical protein [Anaerolineales bacterium]